MTHKTKISTSGSDKFEQNEKLQIASYLKITEQRKSNFTLS